MPTISHTRNTNSGLTLPGVAGGTGIEISGNYHRTYADMRALDRALVLDDLTAARQAFDRLQEDSPRIAVALSHDPFPVKNHPVRALKVVGRCLLTGRVRLAKQAFQHFHLLSSS